MSKSELVKSIGDLTPVQLRELTVGLQLHTKKVARRVILAGMTYEEAGEPFGMSKHAVYELLKRLYKKRHGKEYGKE